MSTLKLNYVQDSRIIKMVDNSNLSVIRKSVKSEYKSKKRHLKVLLKEQKYNAFQNSKSVKLELHALKRIYKKEVKNIIDLYQNKVDSIKRKAQIINGKSLDSLIYELESKLIFLKSKNDTSQISVVSNELNNFKNQKKNFLYSEKDQKLINELTNEKNKKLEILKNKYFLDSNSKKATLTKQHAELLDQDKNKYKKIYEAYKNKNKKYLDLKNSKLKKSRIDYKDAIKNLKKENISINSYNEAVAKVEESSYNNINEFLTLPEDKFKNHNLYKSILVLQNKLKSISKKQNFEAASNYVLLTHKIVAYKKIMESDFEFDNKIIALQNQIKKIGAKNQNSIKDKQVDIKAKYLEKIKLHKSKVLTMTKQAYKNELSELKFKRKLELREAKISDAFYSKSEQLRFLKIDKRKQKEKILKVMFTTVDDEIKKIPTRAFKGQRWLAMLLSIIFPGLGQILNKEYTKGLIFFIGAVFIYAIALPTFFGAYGSNDGNGIFGLFDLSPVKFNHPILGTVYADARYRIVEGVIALILLTFSLVIWISTAHNAYRSGFYREFGYRPANVRDMKKFLMGTGLPILISLPALVTISFIVILPLATTILIAFTNYSVTSQPPGNPLSWNGFDNFVEVFTGGYSESFAYVSGWTVIWTFSVTALTVVIGTVMALILDNPRIKGKKFFSMVYILPWAVPAFATILFFSAAFLGARTGNAYYNQFFNTDINFSQDAQLSRLILVLIQTWLGSSYVFMLVTGIKKGISSDLYEAAEIDGSSKINTFLRITAPLILQQVAPLLIGQFIFNFNNFGIIYLFGAGGVGPAGLPGNPGPTDIIISLIFNLTTSSDNQIGLASAFTIIMSIFIVGTSAVLFLRSRAFRKDTV
ncbi:ABC transporter permease subunit [Mycoplasmopsis agassizii]|uniref:ABC transporter permease subunit n=1 Tax=Mycoplasmopsis agassizii TaxID=33922 RepID=UPI0035283224